MSKIKVAVDIDGTIRDVDFQIRKMLERDHPNLIEAFDANRDKWGSLDIAFSNDRERVQRWLYDERAFQIFAQAPRMYSTVIEDLNAISDFCDSLGTHEVWISSVQKRQSIVSSMFWLSKWGSRVRNIRFFNTFQDKINASFDVVVDDHPGVLREAHKTGKLAICIDHPYNRDLDSSITRISYENDGRHGLLKLIDLIKKEEE